MGVRQLQIRMASLSYCDFGSGDWKVGVIFGLFVCEEHCADLQRVKQEDNIIRYIVYRHVSTIRVTYLLHYLW